MAANMEVHIDMRNNYLSRPILRQLAITRLLIFPKYTRLSNGRPVCRGRCRVGKSLAGFSIQNGQKLFLDTVGLADPNEPENRVNIRTSLQKQLSPELMERAKIFHLRGGDRLSKALFWSPDDDETAIPILAQDAPGKTNSGKPGAHRNL